MHSAPVVLQFSCPDVLSRDSARSKLDLDEFDDKLFPISIEARVDILRHPVYIQSDGGKSATHKQSAPYYRNLSNPSIPI